MELVQALSALTEPKRTANLGVLQLFGTAGSHLIGGCILALVRPVTRLHTELQGFP
jgi:hypothetical protein